MLQVDVHVYTLFLERTTENHKSFLTILLHINSSPPLPSPIPDILWTKSINVIVKDNANNDFNLEQLP